MAKSRIERRRAQLRRRKYWRQLWNAFEGPFFTRNVVLTAGLGIFPILAGAMGWESAGALFWLCVCTMVPVCLLSSLVGQRLPLWMRPPLSIVVAAGVLWLVTLWQPWLLRTTGAVGCLMAVGSVMLSHASDYAPGHILMGTLADSLGAACGFGMVALVVGGVRALLTGSVWWQQGDVWGTVSTEVLSQPFVGLLLLGVLAAALQKGNQVRRKWAKRREEP